MIRQPVKLTETLLTPPAKPFLKWAGGKGQLLEKFRDLYPSELTSGKLFSYYEPFVGGGAVFFDLSRDYTFNKSFLYDINEELILVYQVIQQSPEKLIETLLLFEKEYIPLDKFGRKTYFYNVRESFNNLKNEINFERFSGNWILRAAQSIFLNKTCYNGLFRFNSSGGFNTPSGDYQNPRICVQPNIYKVSTLLKDVTIKCTGFERVIEDIDFGNNNFVYFDPPYRPLNKSSNFTAYSRHNFTDDHQIRLSEVFAHLDRKGCKLMLSNSDPKNIDTDDNFFDELYQNYNIRRIPARRNINSNATRRGLLNEIVVTNY
jgi:DNA adenine methylase